MHRADETVETVPAETGTPVEIGLEQAAGEARRQRQRERQPASPRNRERLGFPSFEQRALAHGKRHEPAHDDGNDGADANGNERQNRERRSARTMREELRRGPRHGRVGEERARRTTSPAVSAPKRPRRITGR